MIHLDETPDSERIDSTTLPPFSNNSRCPQCRLTSAQPVRHRRDQTREPRLALALVCELDHQLVEATKPNGA
jgi:hypothetical protein